jgi:hypothetical protein
MTAGDLVEYNWPRALGDLPDPYQKGVGIVVSVKVWQDSGAPDRNFGVTVSVMWPDGTLEQYEEDELALVS